MCEKTAGLFLMVLTIFNVTVDCNILYILVYQGVGSVFRM